jgi:hypothetical protein
MAQDISRRITQNQTSQCRDNSNPDRIHKRIDCLGMNHKLTEIGKGESTVGISESIEHDQQQRHHHKDSQKQGIGNRPVPASHEKRRNFTYYHFLPY